MVRLKNKFLLILASIVGLCCSFCFVLFRPSAMVTASADTSNDVNKTTDRIYYCLPQSMQFSGISTADEGKLIVFHSYGSNGVVYHISSAVITFQGFSGAQFFAVKQSSSSIIVQIPYYFYSSMSTLNNLAYSIVDLANDRVSTYELTPTMVANITKHVVNPYSTGYSKGYDIGKQEGYDEAYDEVYDLGYLEGDNNGYGRGYIDASSGLWGTRFDFSFEGNHVDVDVDFDAFDVYQNGGISFNKLKPLFYEACEIQGVTPKNIDTTPLTVTVDLNPLSTNLSVLATGISSICVFDSYYTADGRMYWGSWSEIDTAEESGVFSFDTYSELSVKPDTLTFTFDSTWDFYVYASDHTIGFSDYNVGYTQGSTDGYEEGFADGKAVSKNELDNAYNKGYAVGLAKAEKFDFAFAVSTVVGAPVQVVKEFLSFELLGVNMLAFFSGIFSLLLIVKVIRFFI